MKIGIDLSPLQNAHRMRGIGFTLINLINNIPDDIKQNNTFVFYVLPKGEALFSDPFSAINIEGLNYEVCELKHIKHTKLWLPGRLNLPFRIYNRLLRFHSFYFGDSRIETLKGIDVFLQADQNQALPRGFSTRKILIIYDLIPQILEWDYLPTYRTCRQKGCSIKRSASAQFKRSLLVRRIKRNAKRANNLIAISKKTKADFVDFLGINKNKIDVVPLGVDTKMSASSKIKLKKYVYTGWGYTKRPLTLTSETPYLLFIGGVDSRRKVEDVVTAFNHLRSQNIDLKLVLAGDIMLGPDAITNEIISGSLASSSYINDIIFMGFIDDETRSWLYTNALVYIFPSRYEGFGLPVLEAMVQNCPVICYKNAAVIEVAGDAPLYADSSYEIEKRIEEILSYTPSQRQSLLVNAKTRASKYNWRTTADSMFKIICR